MGFLASMSILQIALQATTALNGHFVAFGSDSGGRIESHRALGFRPGDVAAFSVVFALAGVASLIGLLHSGNVAGWLAICASAAGVANLITARRYGSGSPATLSGAAKPIGASRERTARDIRGTMKMGLIEVQRRSGGYTEHLDLFEVVIDDEVVGRLGPGESETFEVTPGAHQIFAVIYWCRSETIDVKLRGGQKMIFRCETRARVLTDPYWATIGRDRYLKLSELRSST